MSTERRPDGRVVSEKLDRLRAATRALRLHLDSLPIDYRLGDAPERFLAGLAVASARQRYDCAESFIGAGFGGMAAGALARGLLVDALRWTWIAASPGRSRRLLADLLAERSRLCELVDSVDADAPTLPRWLQPLPSLAGLTGFGQRWEELSPIPGDDELLSDFLSSRLVSAAGETPEPSLARVLALLAGAELKGATMVLAHAGHGNYLGLLSTVGEGGAPGFDLREDHEALFLQAAATGVVGVVVGASLAPGNWWPGEVDRGPFIETALTLGEAVSEAAVAVHGLIGKSGEQTSAAATERAHPPGVTHPRATVRPQDVWPDVVDVEEVWTEASKFFDLVQQFEVELWTDPPQPFHIVLSYGSAVSSLQSVLGSRDRVAAEIIAPHVARLMLEEAARTTWRYANPDPAVFERQAVQYFDEYRARKKRTIDQLAGRGVKRSAAEAFFELPSYVNVSQATTTITPGRQKLPDVASMVRHMSHDLSGNEWMELAYSLLSQVTHTTPLGLLHSVRFERGQLKIGETSREMTALSLDVLCLAGTRILSTAGFLLRDLDEPSKEWRNTLMRQAAVVHALARMAHGLD